MTLQQANGLKLTTYHLTRKILLEKQDITDYNSRQINKINKESSDLNVFKRKITSSNSKVNVET